MLPANPRPSRGDAAKQGTASAKKWLTLLLSSVEIEAEVSTKKRKGMSDSWQADARASLSFAKLFKAWLKLPGGQAWLH